MAPHRARLGAVLGLTFLSFLIAPFYMRHLRRRFAAQLPEEWAKVTNNGPFTYVSPLIVTTRNHEEGVYAIKLVQLLRHGFPFDPHTGDRSLKSWVFDSMMFYPLAPFALLTGGNVQAGWILAHAALGTLWLLGIYLLFRWYGGEPEYSLGFATFTFAFLDTLQWIPTNVIPSLVGLRPLGQTLFHLLARACGQPQFLRLPSTGMTFLWLYGALAAAFALAQSPRRRFFAAAGVGAAIGLLGLAHFYEWVFGVSTLALFLVAAWQFRLESNGIRNLAAAALVSILVSGAYYATASTLTRDVMPDIVARLGYPHTRVFFGDSLWWVAFAFLFLQIAKRRAGRMRCLWLFAAIQNLAAALCMNLSLVLGYELQFTHFGSMGALTTTLAGACLLLENRWLKERLRPHSLVLTLALFGWVGLREKSWAETHYRLFGTPHDVASAAAWLDANAPRGARLVSLSGILTEFLPHLVDMRWPVANGSPAYGSPVSTAYNLTGLGRILKTLDVDLSKFLDRRFRGFHENDDMKQLRAYLTRNLDWAAAERSAWPYFLLNVSAYRILANGPEERAVAAAMATEAATERPFYFWMEKGDEDFMRSTPETLGARLLYRNESTRLYLFP